MQSVHAEADPSRIGERTVAAATERSRAWSEGEQSSVDVSTDATRAGLVEANLAYERKFGFTYIVRAAGRSAGAADAAGTPVGQTL